ncbi:MAG: Hsp20/alpha crystallin family protein [Nitrospiraceae bacterium]|nr:Hsp20/alpha crystallin family protein [Nitrospiraceae bacterium]
MATPATRHNNHNSVEVVRADPFAELEHMAHQLSSMWDPWRRMFEPLGMEGFTPLADVEETDDNYLVEVELPGIKKEEVTIEVSGRRLTVRGERKQRDRVGVLRHNERIVGSFCYEVMLPDEVDVDKIDASLAEGVLTVKVPKTKGARSKRIELH